MRRGSRRANAPVGTTTTSRVPKPQARRRQLAASRHHSEWVQRSKPSSAPPLRARLMLPVPQSGSVGRYTYVQRAKRMNSGALQFATASLFLSRTVRGGAQITIPAGISMKKAKENSEKKAHAKNGKMKRKAYEKALRKLQVGLCYVQEWVKAKGLRVIIVFEGRDAAGKGGTIKALTERVSPRVFRVVALPAPSDR